MPTYLCHGFRWRRDSIRIFIAIHDLGDGAVEWIIAPRSARALLSCFHDLFDFLPQPSTDIPGNLSTSSSSSSATTQKQSSYRDKDDLSHDGRGQQEEEGEAEYDEADDHSIYHDVPTDQFPVKLLEEYDPDDLKTLNAPWAYVADRVIPVDTSVNIMEEMARYEKDIAGGGFGVSSSSSSSSADSTAPGSSSSHAWLEKLRDELQKGEDIQWFVVVCGDEERRVSDEEEVDQDEEAVSPHAAETREPVQPGAGHDKAERDLREYETEPTRPSASLAAQGGESDGDPAAASTSNDGNTPKSSNRVRRLMSKLHVGRSP